MRIGRRFAAALLGGCLVPAAFCVSAQASTTVGNQNDSGPGSLRETIEKAPSGETIVVPAGTYTLSSGTIKVGAKNLTIEGHGAGDTIIRPQMEEPMFAVFNSTFSISGVTMCEGRVVQANAAGGAIIGEDSNLTLKSDAIVDNSAISNGGSGEKGGFALAAGVGVGGGTLTILDSTISGNTVEANGGSEAQGGTALGAGVYFTGSALTIERSTISGNRAFARGGSGPSNAKQAGDLAEGAGLLASAEENGTLKVAGVTVSENLADASGGPGGEAGQAIGAGVVLGAAKSSLLATDMTIAGNTVRSEGEENTKAAIGGAGLVISAPEAKSSQLIGLTIVRNSAFGAPAWTGGANFLALGRASIGDTIIAEGVGTAGVENCGPPKAIPLPPEITSLGFNIDGSDQCGFHAVGDRVNTSPMLGALQNNGGSTATMMPLAGSPAIDQGSALGMTIDQRGAPRPIDFPTIANAPGGDGSDIGAVEVTPPEAKPKLRGIKKSPKKGSATLTYSLTLPSAGAVVLKGKKLKGQKLKVKGLARERTKLIPSRAALKALRKRGKLKVRFSLVYTPGGGMPQTANGTTTLKFKKQRHGRR